MKYIFIDQKEKIVKDKANFNGEYPAIEAIGYAKALRKKLKKKIVAYVQVSNQY